MRQLLFLLVLGLFVVACGGDDKSDSKKVAVKKTKPKPAAKKADGEKIYKQYCVTCHGVYGDMGASGAFDLTTTKLTTDEKVAVVTNGRNTMTPFKGLLSDDKIKAVVEYTETLKKEE